MTFRTPLTLLAATVVAGCATTSDRCSSAAPVACNLHALGPTERARHAELGARLRAAVVETRELDNGLGLRLDVGRASLAEVGEWASLERRCCPFLHLEVVLEPGAGPVWVNLTGPEGTKAVLSQGLSG